MPQVCLRSSMEITMDVSTPRLMRSRGDALIAGVAGGIARYLGVDSTLVRLIFVVLAFSGAGVLLYPLLWIIMPLERTPAPGRATNPAGREPFVDGERVQRLRSDPPTGTDGDADSEIPINNLNDRNPRHALPSARRTWQLGVILIGVGILALLSLLLGPAFGTLLFPMVLIAAGVLVLLRNR